jgi:hypothetical protein
LQPTSSKAQHRRRAKEKKETEPEPKAKPPLTNFLFLTFPVILASIEKVMVRLFANFCLWPLKHRHFATRQISLQEKNSTNQIKCDFFLNT